MSGMPYSKIKIGDVFLSPLAWSGSNVTYQVTDKADGMVEIMSTYQHPSLRSRLWKRPTDRIFNNRIIEGTDE